MFKYLLIVLLIIFGLEAQAFQDYVIITNGTLTDINIENNSIIDVYPLVTIMNNKNTIFVQPLQEGQTTFSILKNRKEKFIFDVNVETTKTTINNITGFEILAIDEPSEEDFILDEPPLLKGGN